MAVAEAMRLLVPPAWRATVAGTPGAVDETPSGPVDEPIAALMDGFYSPTWAWVRSAGQIRAMPDLGLVGRQMVLGDEGRVAVFWRVGMLPDESLTMMERRFFDGVFRVRLSDLSVVRAAYHPPSSQLSPALGVSPDGRQALIGHTVSRYAKGSESSADWAAHGKEVIEARRTQVTLVDFDAGSEVEVDTIPGLAGYQCLGDDLTVQFSPDGSAVALTVLQNPDPVFRPQVRVYDVVAGGLVGLLHE